MANSYDNVQEHIDEIGKIYTNLTSILLEYGYEYILDHLDKADDIKCIDETLKLLQMLELQMDQNTSMNNSKKFQSPQKPAPRKQQSKLPYPKEWNFMTRLATANEDMRTKRVPLIRYKHEPDTLLQYYSKVAAKLDAQIAREFPQAPRNQRLEVMDLRNRLLKRQVQNALETSLKNKIQEKIAQNSKPIRAQRLGDKQLNQSINVENLHLEI